MHSDRAVEETDCPGQVIFAFGQVKMEVLVVRWESEKQAFGQNLRLQGELNSELREWINLKSKHTLLAFILWYGIIMIIDSSNYMMQLISHKHCVPIGQAIF